MRRRRNHPLLIAVTVILSAIPMSLWLSKGNNFSRVKSQFFFEWDKWVSTSPLRLLRLGSNSRIKGRVSIAVRPPMDFDLLSREYIFELRKREVRRYKRFFSDVPYKPSPSV